LAKITTPIQFTDEFGVDERVLAQLGVFNPSLNVDALLFIDPLLLATSAHEEMREADAALKEFLGDLAKLIKAIPELDRKHVAFRTAVRRFTFPEVRGTCLGYGAGSIGGSGVGADMAERLVATAKQITDLGVTDSKLFLMLPLIEEGVGPDLISDMVTNLVFPEIAKFTKRIADHFALETQEFKRNGQTYDLLPNPTQSAKTPLLLLPRDVLRALPLATDWNSISQVAQENQAIRNSFNAMVGDIWKAKSHDDKSHMREVLLSSGDVFRALLAAIDGTPREPYDFSNDPEGELRWRALCRVIAGRDPLERPLSTISSADDALTVVRLIVKQFRHLIEERGLWRELWADHKPRREKSLQRLFFAVADSYCQAFDLDISPEVDTGTGEIDFKFSAGYNARVVVEIKLSDNKNLLNGYSKQLAQYKTSEKTYFGFYLVVVIADLGYKEEQLLKLRSTALSGLGRASDIEIIDGMAKQSASNQ